MDSPPCIERHLPDPYFTFNPGMLDDQEHWTYRDLQRLAMKLGLNGSGKREVLVERLVEWHTTQFSENTRIRGSNFSLLEVDIDDPAQVNPRMLTPLTRKNRSREDGTPHGILSPTRGLNSTPRDPSAKKKLSFSIFNGVKIIPPRPASPPAVMRSSFEVESEEDDLDAEALDVHQDDLEEDNTPVAEADELNDSAEQSFYETLVAEAERVLQSSKERSAAESAVATADFEKMSLDADNKENSRVKNTMYPLSAALSGSTFTLDKDGFAKPMPRPPSNDTSTATIRQFGVDTTRNAVNTFSNALAMEVGGF